MTRSLSPSRALVLLSGGQDSATCLAWALRRFSHVETVGFDYGQRHRVELIARERVRDALRDQGDWGERLGEDHRLSLGAFDAIGETAMTADLPIEEMPNGLPSTFVPGRNIVFLAFASALASRRNLGVVVGGMCGTDSAGYPDCRADTLHAMGQVMQLGIDSGLTLETPLVALTKADTWALAHDIGGDTLVDTLLEETHTCYLGDRTVRHPWGYGCGECPACQERAKGYAAWREGQR